MGSGSGIFTIPERQTRIIIIPCIAHQAFHPGQEFQEDDMVNILKILMEILMPMNSGEMVNYYY